MEEERTGYQKCQYVLQKILDSKGFMVFQVGFVILTCYWLIVDAPNTDVAIRN